MRIACANSYQALLPVLASSLQSCLALPRSRTILQEIEKATLDFSQLSVDAQVCSARADLPPGNAPWRHRPSRESPPARLFPHPKASGPTPLPSQRDTSSTHVALCCASSSATLHRSSQQQRIHMCFPVQYTPRDTERESNHRGLSLSEVLPLRLLKCRNGLADGTRALLLAVPLFPPASAMPWPALRPAFSWAAARASRWRRSFSARSRSSSIRRASVRTSVILALSFKSASLFKSGGS